MMNENIFGSRELFCKIWALAPSPKRLRAAYSRELKADYGDINFVNNILIVLSTLKVSLLKFRLNLPLKANKKLCRNERWVKMAWHDFSAVFIEQSFGSLGDSWIRRDALEKYAYKTTSTLIPLPDGKSWTCFKSLFEPHYDQNLT